MFQSWSKRQKILVASYFGLVLVAGVALLVLKGGFNFKADQPLGAYDNQASLSYTDSQGQTRNIQSNIVTLIKNQTSYPLSGQVTDSEGQPVVNATVSARKFVLPGFFAYFPEIANTITDSNGNYHIDSVLPTGDYRIFAIPQGGSTNLVSQSNLGDIYVPSHTGQYAQKTTKIISGQDATLNLVIRSAAQYTDNVRVKNRNTAIKDKFTGDMFSNGRVLIENLTTQEIVYDKTTDENGEFSVYPEDSVADGQYNIYFAKNGYIESYGKYGPRIDIPLYLDQWNPRLFFSEVDPSPDIEPTLKGTIKNSDGQPLSNVALLLNANKLNVGMTTATNENGEFQFKSICYNPASVSCKYLWTGDYTLRAIPSVDYQSIIIDPVHLIADQTTDWPPITLSTRESFAPSSLPEPSPSKITSNETALTSQDQAQEQLTESAEVEELSGTYVNTNTNQPVPLAIVTLKSNSGEIIDQTMTDQDGKYTLSYQTAKGDYKIELEKDGYETQTKSISLSEKQSQTVDIMDTQKKNRFIVWLKSLWMKITRKK